MPVLFRQIRIGPAGTGKARCTHCKNNCMWVTLERDDLCWKKVASVETLPDGQEKVVVEHLWRDEETRKKWWKFCTDQTRTTGYRFTEDFNIKSSKWMRVNEDGSETPVDSEWDID